MTEVYRDLMEENGFGPRFGLDFDQMHGVWVQDIRFPGSYGRIAFRDDLNPDAFWVRWNKTNAEAGIKLQTAASCVETKHLKLLKVTPDPWFVKCRHCGAYGLPVQYAELGAQDET